MLEALAYTVLVLAGIALVTFMNGRGPDLYA